MNTLPDGQSVPFEVPAGALEQYGDDGKKLWPVLVGVGTAIVALGALTAFAANEAAQQDPAPAMVSHEDELPRSDSMEKGMTMSRRELSAPPTERAPGS